MMRSLRVAALAPVLFGCATISTSPGTGPVPRGIRLYPPRILLLVDGEYDGGKGRSWCCPTSPKRTTSFR